MKIDPLVTRYFNSFDGKNGNTVKALPKTEEMKLFRRWKNKKDKAALNKLCLANLKFVVRCANKFQGHADGKAIDINDLIQAGNEGLMQAIIHFKPAKNARLITYAVHWINAYIRNFIYANASTVRVSLNNKTKTLIDQKWIVYNLLNGKDEAALTTWRERFKQKYKLSEKTMKAEEEKIQTIGSIFSIDKERSFGGDSSESTSNLHNELNNYQANVDHIVETKNEQELIRKRVRAALKRIPQRDRDILRERFGIDKSMRDVDPMTMQQCADKLGISRQRIEQLQCRALGAMKERLEKDRAIQEIIGMV